MTASENGAGAPSPAIDLGGRRALVTGGSRGIGAAVCRLLAAAGARVAVHCRADREAARATLAALPGEGHLELAADLADPAACRRLVDEAVAGLGGLDVLVNNAGVYEVQDVPALDYDGWLAHWRRVLDVDLLGAANVLFLAARHMAGHGGGRIVNVGSRGAFRGEPTSPAYGAAKAGLHALGQSLAQAFAPRGVIVTTVAPGFVETDMTTGLLRGEAGEAIRRQSPLNRAAAAEEVAAMVAFLASGRCDYATGCIVDVNGASYLRT